VRAVLDGIPVQKITIVMAILVVAFLGAGVALAIAGHNDQANICFGVAVGAVGGSGATTVVVAQNGTNGKTPPAPPASSG